MTDPVKVVLQATVTVFGFEAAIDLAVAGAPFSIALSPDQPCQLSRLWQQLSATLQAEAGFSLPDLGAWSKLIGADARVMPSLWLGPASNDPKALSLSLTLDYLDPIQIGGKIDLGGGVSVEIAPNFTVQALYIVYDSSAGGLGLRARVSTPTTAADGSTRAPKTQVLSYPFPVPAQDSAGTFQLHYVGLGQRVGPNVKPSANDPMTAIFEQLETDLCGDDPRTVLSKLATDFYQPDRGWFIALDAEMKGFRLRVLFNDPAMYGLELSVADNAPSPFAGLLFEILYQKLSPNLGLYYGALTLPILMRRIPLNGFILILPGFQLWVYTNGDFRVNVGWPLGSNSIGISFDILIGNAGFYLAKLRSGDNPGALPSVNYNPILAFGLAVSLSAGYNYNASIFNASINASLSASFQGLLAWKSGNTVSNPPDHYWFAATAGLSVLIQGSVDFSIIRASVTISFVANVGAAFETACKSVIMVSAEVDVEVRVKVVFFTIHLSFSTSVSTQFTIGSGKAVASINGPLGMSGIVGEQLSLLQQRSLAQARHLLTQYAAQRANGLALAVPALIELRFVLQPTATYDSGGVFALIGSLITDSPAPAGAHASPASPGYSSFERLIRGLVNWLLTLRTDGHLSARFAALVTALGHGAEQPLGSWDTFERGLRTFLREQCSFSLSGVDATATVEQHGASVAMLPMFDMLRLTAPDGDTIDFDSYSPAPANYPVALDYYFADLAGANAASGEVSAAVRSAGLALQRTPAARSVATYVFLDYFLMQACNAVGVLHTAALAYETQATEELLARLAPLGATDEQHAASLVADYAARLGGNDELTTLLAGFDYLSAAGIGSRFLLGGLQLPDPAQIPAVPTRANMANAPTKRLYILTGQQCNVPANALASATLSVNSDSTLPPLNIDFGASPAAALATFHTPPTVPASPSPTWYGPHSPGLSGPGDLHFGWVPPVRQQAAYIALRTTLGWNAPGGLATLLPLPEPVQTLLAERRGLGLSITAAAPPADNRRASVLRAAAAAVTPATAALQIRMSLLQVPSNQGGTAAVDGSPFVGSPVPPMGGHPYLPHVYQLGATDEATRDLIHLALLDAATLSRGRISLLYPDGDGGMRSDQLGADVLLVKTNLSTLNLVPETGTLFALQAAQTASAATDMAPVSDPVGFLRLVWELSVVNAPGYFLYYQSIDGGDLPAAMFATSGAEGGKTGNFDILVEFGDAVGPTVLPAYANSVLTAGKAGSEPLYAGLLDSQSGQPVLTSSPAYRAGAVAFTVDWVPVADVGPVPVGQLYQLLQCAVVADANYQGSAWGLPIGPSHDASADSPGQSSHYLRSIPVASFLRAAPGSDNRYAAIGKPVTIDLRIVDLYGNPLPANHQDTETPGYQDPILSLGEWPGVSSRYHIDGDGSGKQAVLTIALDFDAGAIVQIPGSPHGEGIAPERADAMWARTLSCYQLIVDQLTDPHLTVEFCCSLLSGAVESGSNVALLIGMAQTITSAIKAYIDSSPSAGNGPVVPAVILTQHLPFATVQALDQLLLPLTVSVAFKRPAELLDPVALVNMPAALSVRYNIAPDLGGEPVSPAIAGAIGVFAAAFESAFQHFDGHGGCLKLAQRAGVAVSGPAAAPALWCMRWSATCGAAVTLAPDLVHFALAPLSVKPMTVTTEVQTWSNIDLDAWARSFLVAFDAFLAPQLAAAIAVLDLRDGTSLFEQLVQTKQKLAAAIKLGLRPLFIEQQDGGDIIAAQDRFEQAMLDTLASAFTVTTIVQIPAAISITGSPPAESPGVAPRLFGNIGGGDASPASDRTSPYCLSSGNLELAGGGGWLTTLLTVAQAERQARLVLPLDYRVSYLQHDFDPGEEYLGYIPSSWLKFALPAAAPLDMPVCNATVLPVPLIFRPVAPILSRQSASDAPLPSPSIPQSAQQEIAQAMRWIYRAGMVLALAAQDALYFDVSYNSAQSQQLRLLRDNGDPLLTLLSKLAEFQGWYADAAGRFNAITDAAFPRAGAPPPATSPQDASQLITDFQDYAHGVADAWADMHVSLKQRTAPAAEASTDHFCLKLGTDDGKTCILLHGYNGADGPPLYWPALFTGEGLSWTPTGKPRPPIGAAKWYTYPTSFTEPQQLDALTLEFGPLDIMRQQSAILSSRIVRNTGLLDNMQTATDFIYQTQSADFPTPAIPLIHRASLPPVAPAASLVQTLTEILTPIEQVGAGQAPSLRLSAVYQYAASPTLPLMVSTAVTLVKDSAMSSPQALAQSTAATLAAWHETVRPSTLNANLSLAITVFGTQGGITLPLVQFDQIIIPTGDLPDAWWRAKLP